MNLVSYMTPPRPIVHEPLIRIEGLTKRFGNLDVLHGLDVEMVPGRVTAVVGPNGSGKTTLIKLILGLVRPDAGRIEIGGCELGTGSDYRHRIGYMPQAARFPENLSARDLLAMLKDLRGGAARTDHELIDAFGLVPELDKPIRTLSGGTRQKVSAAVAFLFDPDLVILDEPTAGLDPVASSRFKDKITREKARGKTFLLASHIMSELEELADDVAFLLDGRIRFFGAVASIKQATGHTRLERAIAHMMGGKAA